MLSFGKKIRTLRDNKNKYSLILLSMNVNYPGKANCKSRQVTTLRER
jgi:hypothetical protein